jgi:hypothetical protein
MVIVEVSGEQFARAAFTMASRSDGGLGFGARGEFMARHQNGTSE